ncbi:MAG: Crp/Fnr family transcriptional regulator [Bacillota bacterium]|nr:Crp/Fnr family transcriptional regulator [Bacillota bacterium]
MYNKWVPILQHSPLFAEISDQEIIKILDCLKPLYKHYQKGELSINNDFNRLGIVLKGELRFIKEDAKGNRTLVNIIKEEETFGEIETFAGTGLKPMLTLAEEPCSVMYFQTDKIIGHCKKVCSFHKTMLINLLKIVAFKASLLNRQVDYLGMKSLREKISTFLLETYKQEGSKTFILQITRYELAEFLNVSRPSLSRELSNMRDEGIIDFYRASIRIIDIDGLLKAVSR